MRMRTLGAWLAEYDESHRHPANKLLHWTCVPAIVLAVTGLLWSIPVPDAFARASPWLNWATLTLAATVVYYAVLSVRLAVGIVLAYIVVVGGVLLLQGLPWPLWASALAIFVAGWIGQFIGHAVEGRRPSFFKDVQFLLIGPLWLLAGTYRLAGIRY
jgi:uncharacterized membrane protein YGL010W